MLGRLLSALVPLRLVAWCFGCLWNCKQTPVVECNVNTNDFASYSGFTTNSGSWSASGVLTTSSSLARTTCNTDSPTIARRISIDVKTSINQNVSVRIGSHRATLSFHGTNGALGLYDASPTLLDEARSLPVTPDTFFTLVVCYDGASLSAYVEGMAGSLAIAPATFTDLTNGLSTGFINSSPFYFDNWVLKGNTGDPGCDCVPPDDVYLTYSCAGPCLDNRVPEQFQVEISGITGFYYRLNGTYVLDHCVPTEPTDQYECQWFIEHPIHGWIMVALSGTYIYVVVNESRTEPPKCKGLGDGLFWDVLWLFDTSVAGEDVDCLNGTPVLMTGGLGTCYVSGV